MPYALKHRSVKQKELRARRASKGICYVCSKPVIYYKRCTDCLEKQSVWHNKRYSEIKKLVFEYYGGAKCNCCGESTIQFLSVDHVNNDGAVHRKQYGNTSGKKIYFWLVKNNFPEHFQILCMNCNFGKRINKGTCPHKELVNV